MTDIPRPEYPRPQFVREHWLNLNGPWRFAYDDHDQGLKDRWYQAHNFDRSITVPFAYQTRLSGIHDTDFHDIIWYERTFTLPQAWAGHRLILHFGAVDYRAQVWVNGACVAIHEGGHVPFAVDITHAITTGDNRITLRVEDSTKDLEQPRGKQYWERESASIFYTRTTGIWQTVWLEPVSDVYLDHFKLTPDIDAAQVHMQYVLNRYVAESDIRIDAEITLDGAPVSTHTHTVDAFRTYASIALGDAAALRLWSPESPTLYDLTLTVRHGDQVIDRVQSYFGMRKISIDGGQVKLNNQPYYMRLVLDQGYHPEGLLTFPSDDALKQDVLLTKEMGFNGARKHQKVEDPRYLYWADKLGLLVWGEMANAYQYSERAVGRITQEWQEAIARDYNHPCIVAWVPINESWGVPDLHGDRRQVDHLLGLYHLVRSLDPSRLVISNDGWEHARTDLLTIHDYEGSGDVLRARYGTLESTLQARPANRDLYVGGFTHEGQPILVTEFGGIGYQKDAQEGWGYTTAGDDDEFIRRYRDVVMALRESPLIQGFCYTQITDVEQEINGLLTYDRKPKVDLAIIREITAG